jgi:type I restriction enzyme, S subunit
LLKGLEVSVLRKSEALEENNTKRIDPEFFIKAAVEAFRRLKDEPRLGDFVKDGYRVVYETTKVVDRDEGVSDGLPFFLQSADITTPFINADRMACVPEADWLRYPRGRIKAGELLIEVKGKAEKVAVVPDDFPSRTLVTGTCYKLTTHEKWQRSLLVAHLIGRYGAILKDRLKTNLLVAYIAKDDLYRIPVPNIGEALADRVHAIVQSSLAKRNEILQAQESASSALLSAIGLADWTPPEPLSYTARASDVFASGRFDAQYFMPAKEQVKQSLAVLPGQLLSDRVNSIRDQWVPDRAPPTMRVRNYDLTDALVPLLDAEKEPSFADEIGSMKKVFKDGDVAISRLRAYLKEVAVVRTGDDICSVGSSEFIVLRPKDKAISPETLMVFLRSAPVQTILKWCQDGSQHPRFSEADLLSIPVPDAVATVSDQITKIVQDGFTARHRARKLLEAAKCAVEIAIEDGELAAMAYLDQAEGAV